MTCLTSTTLVVISPFRHSISPLGWGAWYCSNGWRSIASTVSAMGRCADLGRQCTVPAMARCAELLGSRCALWALRRWLVWSGAAGRVDGGVSLAFSSLSTLCLCISGERAFSHQQNLTHISPPPSRRITLQRSYISTQVQYIHPPHLHLHLAIPISQITNISIPPAPRGRYSQKGPIPRSPSSRHRVCQNRPNQGLGN